MTDMILSLTEQIQENINLVSKDHTIQQSSCTKDPDGWCKIFQMGNNHSIIHWLNEYPKLSYVKLNGQLFFTIY